MAQSDRLLNAEESAEYLGITERAFWQNVAKGRLPVPFYPTSRTPRWRQSEIDAALEATRCLPREAMAARRMARFVTKAA